jgi:hypothetical protein
MDQFPSWRAYMAARLPGYIAMGAAVIGVGAVQTGALGSALIAGALFVLIFTAILSLAWGVGLLAATKGGKIGRKLAGLGSAGGQTLELHERRSPLRVGHDSRELPRP